MTCDVDVRCTTCAFACTRARPCLQYGGAARRAAVRVQQVRNFWWICWECAALGRCECGGWRWRRRLKLRVLRTIWMLVVGTLGLRLGARSS